MRISLRNGNRNSEKQHHVMMLYLIHELPTAFLTEDDDRTLNYQVSDALRAFLAFSSSPNCFMYLNTTTLAPGNVLSKQNQCQ